MLVSTSQVKNPKVKYITHMTSGWCSVPHVRIFAWEALPRANAILLSCIPTTQIPDNNQVISAKLKDEHICTGGKLANC